MTMLFNTFLILSIAFVPMSQCFVWHPSIMLLFNNESDNITSVVNENAIGKIFEYVSQSTHISWVLTSLLKQNKVLTNSISDKHERHNGRYVTNSLTAPSNVDVYKENPQDAMTTLQLIASNGYPAESHVIKTEDGYILTLHRIPHGRLENGGHSRTVFLQHGLLSSSADWVLAGPEKGLPYILADAGFDVWLGNTRGNTYSKAHAFLPIDSFEFWNFTFHEAAFYDLPAAIDYINHLKGTTNKIHYIGHSMGTTMLFVLLSTRPEYNGKLRAGYALAPVAFMSRIESPIKYIAPFVHDLEKVVKILGANQFLPQSAFMKWLSRIVCEENKYEKEICENIIFLLCGFDDSQFNKTMLPIILSHSPAGASTKTLIHYAQEIEAKGRFQKFDYGVEGNIKHYGLKTPPEYNLTQISLPISLLCGQNDWLSSLVDTKRLYKALPSAVEYYIVPLKTFNHVDFLWAIDAPKLIYKKLLKLLSPQLE